jgi:redox-sensitive bicupin YhaK (pirin superfamily)
MQRLRRAAERGHTQTDWLDSWHSFSFGGYRDPAHMGFRALRVINDDRVQPSTGFGQHGHRDMEIVTWVLAGELEHRDSLGSGGVLRAGDVQCMSAGSGIVHSELNPSPNAGLHFLQLWILPDEPGGKPSYAQRHAPESLRRGRWCTLVGPRASPSASSSLVPSEAPLLTLGANAQLQTALLERGAQLARALDMKRGAWLQVARGRVRAGEHELAAGDGLALEGERGLELEALEESELLLFDLA